MAGLLAIKRPQLPQPDQAMTVTLPVELAAQPSSRAFYEGSVTFCDLMNTLGDIVALAAGPVSGRSGTQAHLPYFLDRLENLAEELGKYGLRTRLTAPPGRVPSLHVVNPAVSRLAEDVYVGRSQDGMWWFWWPWAERIAPGDHLADAAALIARVLSTEA